MNPEIGTPDYYLPFVSGLLEKLDWKPDPEQMLWHYTTSAGLIGIVQSGSIFATQVSCVNDTTEIRYSAMRLRTALTELLPEIVSDETATRCVKKYVELLQDDDASPNSATLPYFVTCFTPLEDDISQWRGYGGGENGFAIGVRTKDLFGTPNSLIGRVNYDSETHMVLAKEAALKTVEYYKKGLEAGITNWDDRFLQGWDSALTQLAPLAKDPGFAAEKEVRVVHLLQESEITHLKVIPKKTMMSRHLPMRFPASGQTPRLPIAKVIVGPCRHREITRIGVDTLLRTHGYPGGLVVASARPYQDT
jgi:hypothetical protein